MRITIAILLLLAAALPAEGQGLSAGMKVGANLADFYGEDVAETEIHARFTGGPFVMYYFGPVFALQTEALLSEKGARLLDGAGGAASYRFGYMEIPLLVKTYFPTRRALEPNVYVGPVLDVKLYAEQDEQDLGRELKATDFGVAFGAGLDYNLGFSYLWERRVMLEVRYTLGLTDIFDRAGDPEIRNGVLTFAVGIAP